MNMNWLDPLVDMKLYARPLTLMPGVPILTKPIQMGLCVFVCVRSAVKQLKAYPQKNDITDCVTQNVFQSHTKVGSLSKNNQTSIGGLLGK